MWNWLSRRRKTLHEGPGVPQPVTRDFQWWSRALYITIPFLLVLNYFIIFHWSAIEAYLPFTSGDTTELRPFKPPPSSVPDSTQPFDNAPFSDAPTIPGEGQVEEEDNGLDYWTWNTQTQFYHNTTVHTNASTNGTDAACANFPSYLLQNSVQVVLKTGVADDKPRTEAQLATVIKCIPNVFIVSDFDHAYGDHKALDVLKDLPPDEYMAGSAYDFYLEQKNASKEELYGSREGWQLDKYKFLPMVEKAVAHNSAVEWYVFLESDTYIFWDNIFRLLNNYDSTKPWYFGSPSPGKTYGENGKKKVWFAYGGASFVLSSAAAQKLVHRDRNIIGMKGIRVTDQYRQEILDDCCGDSILGWALHDKAGVDISGLFPMFNPHPLDSVPFGKKHWCEPVISLHKTPAQDYAKLWQWENNWNRKKGPLLYRDLLASYHKLGTFERRDDWDNAYDEGYDHDADHPAHASFSACLEECKKEEQCFQVTYHGAHCWMSRALKMGHPKRPDGEFEEKDRKYVSGWDVGKIGRLVDGEKCGDGAHWVKPSITRIF